MMRRFRAPVGVIQGSRVLFADFADGGAMWTGEGPREVRYQVTFKEPFVSAPAVMVSLSMWDMDRHSNSRVDLTSESVSRKGFYIVFRTWGDTRIARVRAEWTAIGQLHDEDDWDVG